MCKSLYVVYLIIYIAPQVVPAHDYPHIRSVFGAIFDSSSPSEVVSPPSPPSNKLCLGCTQKFTEVSQNEQQERYTVTEEELTALRIEYIKNQILKKLRLKEKPTVSMKNLPKPVTEDESFLPKNDDDSYPSPLDDFYGKTTQVIVFPYKGNFNFV